MNVSDNRLLSEFREKQDIYKQLDKTVYSLLKEIKRDNSFFMMDIQHRVKDEKSLKGKLIRKGGKYKNLNEITDLVGFRIICYFSDTVDKVAAALNRYFIIDRENSVDKRAVLQTTQFGYLSLHYICSIPTSLKVLEDAVSEASANVKVLVNNAGFGLFAAFQDGDLNTWLKMVDLNDKALVGLTYLMLPHMSEGSEIINIASMASYQPIPYIGIYGATKAFVLSFTRALNMELKPRKIKAIAVCPFWTKTEFFDVAVKDNSVITYYSHYNTIEKVVTLALKNIKKGKDVSISDFPVKFQRFLVKILPTKMVMKVWCKQQHKPTK